MDILNIAAGFALLLAGRQIYWLFVGVIGFLVGAYFASDVLAAQPEWLILLAALAVGVLSALLAIVLQRVAVGLAGFFGGGYFAMILAAELGANSEAFGLIAFLIGGFVAALLVLVVFDWALIGLSALFGALTIVTAVDLEPSIRLFVGLGLFVVGVVVQTGLLLRHRSQTAVAPPS